MVAVFFNLVIASEEIGRSFVTEGGYKNNSFFPNSLGSHKLTFMSKYRIIASKARCTIRHWKSYKSWNCDRVYICGNTVR